MARPRRQLDHQALAGPLGPLTREDFESVTWRRLQELLANRLERLRRANDSIRPPSEDYLTQILRGRIAELKVLQALGTSPTPGVEPGPDEAPDDPDQ